MKLPSFKRILFNDYQPEYQQLVQQLAVTINNGFEGLINALNKNISLKDNILCDVKDITVTVDASGFPTKETAINSTLSGNPIFIGSQVIYAKNQANSSIYPTSGIFCTFTQTSRGVIINHITGLPANNQFLLRVVLYA